MFAPRADPAAVFERLGTEAASGGRTTYAEETPVATAEEIAAAMSAPSCMPPRERTPTQKSATYTWLRATAHLDEPHARIDSLVEAHSFVVERLD